MSRPSERTSLTSAHGRRKSVLFTAWEGSRHSVRYVPNPDEATAGDCQAKGSLRRKTTTIFDESFEDLLQEEHPEALKALNSSFVGHLVQGLCLVLTVFAYTAGSFIACWVKTVGEKDGKRITGDTFFEPTAVVFTKFIVVLIGFTYALYADSRGWNDIQGGYFRRIFNFSELMRWAPVALGWSIADVAEVMAQGRNMDPATYTVLSQSRLVGTAIVMRMVAGTKRSVLQWSILTTLTLVIIGWNLLPDGFGAVKPKDSTEGQSLGLILTFVKVFLSIVCGVFSQGLLKESSHLPLPILQSQICLMSGLWSVLVLIITLTYVFPYVLHKEWNYEGSFLGGAENIAGGAGFFSIRPYVLILFYIYREYITNICVTNFDVLVKNLCNAAAAVVSYYIACFLTGDKQFYAVKGLFTIVIGFEIIHYAMAPPLPAAAEAETPSSLGSKSSVREVAFSARKLEAGGAGKLAS